MSTPNQTPRVVAETPAWLGLLWELLTLVVTGIQIAKQLAAAVRVARAKETPQ